MTPATTLIPGLDEIVRGGDPKRRADAARRISELFLQGAANFGADHVDLFDGVLSSLVPHADLAARAELAERLSLLVNAPRGLVGQLAHEDEIAIAGPLLRRSPVIDEQILVEIASVKGQGHLLAMSDRPTLSPDLTDVIVRRGDRDVVRRTAGNAGAAFSTDGYSTLIKRAGQDGVLTLKIGQRDDLSAEQLKDLLAGSIDVIRRRLFTVVKPARQVAIKRAMNEISGAVERADSGRDFEAAQRTILVAASRRPTGRKRAAQLCQGKQIRGIRCRAGGDDRREDRNPRPADCRRPLRSDPDRRQGDRPRMGHRARLDPAPARARTGRRRRPISKARA